MRYSSRFFLYAPFALLLLLAATVMAWWKISANAFDQRLAAANGREIMPGVRLSYASKSIGGFPFNIDSVLDGLTLQVRMRTGPLVLRAEHFAIHALTYGPNQQIFEAAGTQTLAWTDSKGAHHQFSFTPGSLRASAVSTNGQLSRFDLDLVALNSPDLTADRLQFHIRCAPQKDALEFVVSGDGIHLAPDLRAGFGDELRQARLNGTIEPTAPLQSLLVGKSDWRASAETWRRNRGVLVVQGLQVFWNKLNAAGRAQLSLDADHRPAGSIDLSIVGAENLSHSSDSRAKLADALASIAPSLRRLNGRSPLMIQLSSGRIYVEPEKPENIVIAVDGGGNVTWNGAPIMQQDLRAKFASRLALSRLQAGEIDTLY